MKTDLKEPECGVACCKGNAFNRLASINYFTGFYSLAGLVVASLSMYIVSQITTIEKQFGLSSSQTGYLLSCNDIGYSVMILIASHFANKIHIPRVLALSTIFYGISGIICCIPHFIYKYGTAGLSGDHSLNSTFSANSKLCINSSDLLTSKSNSSEETFGSTKQGEESIAEIRSAAMAFIGIGMLLQGIGKAPRYPMLATYLDDNTKKQDTGFYMGIITTFGIFGPALAYGLGGVFSQIYVTLEDVDLHPMDPRWLGAWWIGFLLFGICAIILALPLVCFPQRLVPTAQVKREVRRKRKITVGAVFREFKEFLKSIVLVLKSPLYTVTLLGCLVNMIGLSSTMSFTPKYMETQFNIPAWKANVVLGVVGIVSVCIGVFFGGWLTKKIKLNPPKTLMLILVTLIVTSLLTLVTMFLACEKPVIKNWQSNTLSLAEKASLPSCISGCGCNIDQFLPVCGSDGQNYFSPCHAGCSDGLVRTFSNCSCIDGGGTAVSGLCPTSCPGFWPFNVLGFLTGLIGSATMMPFFIFFLRIVPDQNKSMAMGICALFMSLFGWLPGPLIGGKLVDAACILWTSGGSCSFYDIDLLRYNLYGVSLGCKALAVIIFALALWKSWSIRKWPADVSDNDSDFYKEAIRKPEADALMGKFTSSAK